MKLYIETENGQTKNHPAIEENLLMAFGAIPDHWEPFTRVLRPTLHAYQVLVSDTPIYQKVEGVWKDVWDIRSMTAEEITATQQAVKDAWALLPNRDNFTAWTFDEVDCIYVPPVPRPRDNKDYFWQGSTSSWVERPPYPTDGLNYRFDISTCTWVLI